MPLTIERIIAVVSLPLLMFADYYFTLLGKKKRDNLYAQHITSEQYELNPVWQKDVNRGKKFNYKHVLAVILVTGYFYFVAKLLNDAWFDVIFGAFFTMYLSVNMQHFQNILTYRYAAKHPDQLSGKATVGYIISVRMSQFRMLTLSIFLLLIFAWVKSWFVLGGTLGLIVLTLSQFRWTARYRQIMKRNSNTQTAEQRTGQEALKP